jgi:hypothetical protein
VWQDWVSARQRGAAAFARRSLAPNHLPEEQDFFGTTLEEVLAWCLVWVIAPELGIGPFRG